MNLMGLNRVPAAIAALIALLVPTLFAIGLVRAAAVPSERVASGLFEGSLLLAQRDAATPPTEGDGQAEPPRRASGSGLPLGVVYTRGGADVTWNGRTVPVNDGSYSYSGGETVRMATGGLGLLRLAGGGSVFLCGGSALRIRRVDSGYRLELVAGAARFAFPASAAFTVDAGSVRIEPSAPRLGTGRTTGEVHVREDGGCLVCELQGGIMVSAGEARDPGPGGIPGRMVEVIPAGQGEGYAIRSEPIDAGIMAANFSGSGSAPAGAYLCECQELRRRPEDGEEPVSTATTASSDTPPTGEGQTTARPGQDNAAGEGPPPVAPPDAPPAAIADTGPPDPFDPGVLPPPITGEPEVPVVVVAPPSVPFVGTGGGGGGTPASPS